MAVQAIATFSHWLHRWFAPRAGAQPNVSPVAEELRRAMQATRRFETLRFDPQARSATQRDLSGVARQVFDECYAQAPAAGPLAPARPRAQTIVLVAGKSPR